MKKVIDACKRHGKQPGMHCASPAYALKALQMGFTFVTVGGDTRFVTMGAAAAVQEMRAGAGGSVAAKPGAGGSGSSPY
jgi:4-hydroxy-2-oxoheptanedioate aldolase